MALYRLLRRLLVPPLPSGLAGGFFAACYVVMTGAGTSSLRALVMFALFLAAQAAGRTYDLLSALATAGLLLLWEYPLLLWQEGFQLSFLAMAGIGAVWSALDGWLGKGTALRRSLVFSLAIQLATLPVLAWHEGAWPVYGMFLNLLVIPLAAPLLAVTASAAFLACLWETGAAWLIRPGIWILRLYDVLCRLAEKLPGHTYVMGQPELWQIGLYGMALAAGLWLMRRGTFRRDETEASVAKWENKKGRIRKCLKAWCPLVLWAGLLFFTLRPLPFRGLQVTFLDVGQGDCIFIRCEEGCCLIDGGSSSVSDVGEYRILPYLRNQGITRLSGIFVTHGDSDHMNGLESLLRDSSVSVAALYISSVSAGDDTMAGLLAAAGEEGVPVRILQAGDGWSWGDVDFLCQYPGEEDCAALVDDENNTSLVISLRQGDFSVLFTGDLGEEGEERWLAETEDGGYTVLKAGHHGSKYSSSEAFLAAVSPQVTVISCGKNNLYGHPHAETLERLAEAGSVICTTPRYGAVTVICRGGSFQCFGYRN